MFLRLPTDTKSCKTQLCITESALLSRAIRVVFRGTSLPDFGLKKTCHEKRTPGPSPRDFQEGQEGDVDEHPNFKSLCVLTARQGENKNTTVATWAKEKRPGRDLSEGPGQDADAVSRRRGRGQRGPLGRSSGRTDRGGFTPRSHNSQGPRETPLGRETKATHGHFLCVGGNPRLRGCRMDGNLGHVHGCISVHTQ